MADSDNSRTLPSVTRRMLLSGTMATTAMLSFETGADAAEALAGNAASDPARQLWNAWQSACLNTVALWEKQQRLETQLVNTIGFPHAKVYLPDEDATFSIWWEGDIGSYFGSDSASADIRAKAETDFAAHQARWDAEDERIGYSAAKRAEQAAAIHKEELVEALTDTPATTLAGVAGKLDVVLREGQSSGDCTEFPWPLVHSALEDILRIMRNGDAP
ncbi:hypothetical protein GCM10011491_44560 [Brucella endophytica]|uniref:Uncharacterized protein n=1 Tax=Brucella endophytica TaxID=1963359 RepID=A0A916WMA7_9HYPH|nr:hypothetical protein [Brucella endophytica]GGB11743.1 hypothetical protein GCM10011491_44560 [Brucella endophytica]